MTDVERLERRLLGRVGQAIGDLELIEPGNRILADGLAEALGEPRGAGG